MAPPAHLVHAARLALSSSLDVGGTVKAWLTAGRPDGVDGLRSRLVAAGDPSPLAASVEHLRAEGRAGVGG
ncbi:MAG: hypothetical protein M3N98_16080 [Actinomycetota bacterium]|nr:hypothetical protein [Actinomycetota bacterium]